MANMTFKNLSKSVYGGHYPLEIVEVSTEIAPNAFTIASTGRLILHFTK